jgi:phosphoenolpyruvate-protein kinase (PTS system EI component)
MEGQNLVNFLSIGTNDLTQFKMAAGGRARW